MSLESSAEIYQRAIAEYQPYAIVLMMSGGNDSLTAYYVAKKLGIKIDFILHINTGTGIAETTEFVRYFAESEGIKYIEASAGDAYENYVLRKGFFGRGHQAHNFSYHLLKHQRLVNSISVNIRQRRRSRPVLLLNGARLQESENRTRRLNGNEIRRDNGKSANIWVNLVHHWTKNECQSFLGECDAKRNPVAELLCRSAECMCGTMQNQAAREEASYWFPKWGKWLDDLENRVTQKFPWGWAQETPKSLAIETQTGQLRLFDYQLQPMCQDCINHNSLD